MGNVIKDFDWVVAGQNARSLLSPEECRIAQLLGEGKGTYQIASILNTNRSAVWFKAKKIRQKLEG